MMTFSNRPFHKTALSSCIYPRSPDQAPYKCIGRTARDAKIPREEIPNDRSHDGAQDDNACVAAPGTMSPVVIVWATALICVAPSKLSNAAKIIAVIGANTRVAMTVDTTFAASWKPLV